ncbi:MAG: hypothetical protein KBT04_03720 [Bacteroidales bacterium]|nr:hypothetical protein [Candidatus Colimorpha onthohippi]
MTIETLAKQGRTRIHGPLAGINSQQLKKMRDKGLRSCFERFSEMRYRMEYVTRIHNKTFINDASSRNANATCYALENAQGRIVWIAERGNNQTDYSQLKNVALRKVQYLYCVGGADSNMRDSFEGIIPNIIDTDTLQEAVTKAFYCNLEEATILYSPCSPNGHETAYNGESFRNEVNEL